MKRYLIRSIVLLIALTVLPSAAMAYMNNIDVALMSISGSYETPGGLDADISMGSWELGYTRYLKDIETNEMPYGTREFLQHPSRLGVSIDGMGVTMEDNNSAAEQTVGEANFMLGGMYYLDNGVYDTGLGLALVSMGRGQESSGTTFGGTSDTETAGSAVVISVNQYVAENVSIGLDIESGSSTWEDNLSTAENDEDETMTTISVEALIAEKVWIEAGLGGGEKDRELGDDEDIGTFSILAGVYLSQKTGLFLGINTESKEETDGDEEKMTMVHFGGDFYFNEKMHLMASLVSMKNEMSSNGVDTGELKASGIRLEFGAFF